MIAQNAGSTEVFLFFCDFAVEGVVEDFEEPGSDSTALFLKGVSGPEGFEVGILNKVGGGVRMARELQGHAIDRLHVLERQCFKLLPLHVGHPFVVEICGIVPVVLSSLRTLRLSRDTGMALYPERVEGRRLRPTRGTRRLTIEYTLTEMEKFKYPDEMD